MDDTSPGHCRACAGERDQGWYSALMTEKPPHPRFAFACPELSGFAPQLQRVLLELAEPREPSGEDRELRNAKLPGNMPPWVLHDLRVRPGIMRGGRGGGL